MTLIVAHSSAITRQALCLPSASWDLGTSLQGHGMKRQNTCGGYSVYCQPIGRLVVVAVRHWSGASLFGGISGPAACNMQELSSDVGLLAGLPRRLRVPEACRTHSSMDSLSNRRRLKSSPHPKISQGRVSFLMHCNYSVTWCLRRLLTTSLYFHQVQKFSLSVVI